MSSYNELLNLIKQIIGDYINTLDLSNVVIGKVIRTSPLTIQIEQKFSIDKQNMIMTKSVSELGLAAGDKVVMLKAQGGQKYIILDKVV